MTPGIYSASKEMSTRIFLGSRERSERKTDYFPAICELIMWKVWAPRHLTTL
jgi:hypothetical protein